MGGVFPIFDEAGHFFGDSTGGSRFSALVNPGLHYFIAWGPVSTESLRATLVPGRTYWVLVTSRPSLYAVTRSSGSDEECPLVHC